MNKDFVEKMHRKLMEDKTELLRNIAAERSDFRAVVENMGVKDLADLAADDFDVQMLDAIGTKDMARLRMIESAIGRVNRGQYGVCGECGSSIPEQRLEAIPYAPLCIQCQETTEKRR